MALDAKDRLEQELLNRFLASRGIRPRRDPERRLPPAPDFDVALEDGSNVAVELTALVDERRQESSAAMARFERVAQELLADARVFVHVLWRADVVLPRRVERLAESLVAHARAMAVEGREEADAEEGEVDGDLAHYVGHILVLRRDYGPLVSARGEVHVATRLPGTVQRALDAKEAKVPAYREATGSGVGLWLLLTTHGRPSETLGPSLLDPAHVYRSSFDRVFLLDGPKGDACELRVASASGTG